LKFNQRHAAPVSEDADSHTSHFSSRFFFIAQRPAENVSRNCNAPLPQYDQQHADRGNPPSHTGTWLHKKVQTYCTNNQLTRVELPSTTSNCIESEGRVALGVMEQRTDSGHHCEDTSIVSAHFGTQLKNSEHFTSVIQTQADVGPSPRAD